MLQPEEGSNHAEGPKEEAEMRAEAARALCARSSLLGRTGSQSSWL